MWSTSLRNRPNALATDAQPTRVRIATLGCRLNQAESEETAEALRSRGLEQLAAATPFRQGGVKAAFGRPFLRVAVFWFLT